MSGEKLTVDAELELLQRESFSYFLHETNPANGLVIDKTAPDWPASIAATGVWCKYSIRSGQKAALYKASK
jgi:hypothetical protein